MNSEPSNLKRVKYLVATGGVLAVALTTVAFAMLVFRPSWEHQQQQKQRASQLEALLQRSAKVKATHRELKANLTSLRQSVQETLQRLPAELGDAEFISQVKSLASSLNVEITNHTIANLEHHASFSKAHLIFEGQGSYASICELLERVNQFPRLTELDALEIEPEEKLGRYPFQVSFVLYFVGKTHDTRVKGDVL